MHVEVKVMRQMGVNVRVEVKVKVGVEVRCECIKVHGQGFYETGFSWAVK